MPPRADVPGDGGASSGNAAGGADGAAAQLQAWLSLGSQAVGVAEQLATVLRLELGLALADARRLLIVVLAMIPLALLAWISVCVLAGWLAYSMSESVALAIGVFLFLQLVTLALLLRAARRFQSSLGLPASRRQWQALTQSSTTATQDAGRGR